jgi:bifunctional ADP-heptose synthase (sugar kinase/adenylyltransferase)
VRLRVQRDFVVSPCPTDFQLCAHASPLLPCQAEHSSVVKAQYDYDAAAEGELSVKEDQLLLVFGQEEDGWLLVQDKVEWQGRLRSRKLYRGQSLSFSLTDR